MLDFLKYKYIYFVISILVIVPGLISLILYGLKPSIDFTGGSLLEVKVSVGEQLTVDKVRESVPDEISVGSIQALKDGAFIIKTEVINKDQAAIIKNKLASSSGVIKEVRFETVGPTIGEELLRKTLAAVIIAAGVILFYVVYKFSELKYGACAILAMFHDTFILLGIFSLLGHFIGVEIDVLFVTAVLTVLSFSVHDTIVVYDRIRETIRRNPKANFENVVNKAITETLGRSINNSMTIIFMLLSLWLLGGGTIKWFVLALLIGTISGTYSSTFTAAPLLIIWDKLKKNKA